MSGEFRHQFTQDGLRTDQVCVCGKPPDDPVHGLRRVTVACWWCGNTADIDPAKRTGQEMERDETRAGPAWRCADQYRCVRRKPAGEAATGLHP